MINLWKQKKPHEADILPYICPHGLSQKIYKRRRFRKVLFLACLNDNVAMCFLCDGRLKYKKFRKNVYKTEKV